ncbi:MAG: PQQ-dependent sugar dehydrogenase [Paracoccaceae bacterium]|nr:MAG: PQQ-dependent sugar dehydrogenase [Paracoccaceae bacterium]
MTPRSHPTRRSLLSSLAGAAVALPWLSRGLAAQGLGAEAMATGLDQPWSLAFLPGGAFLVTERGGNLLHYAAPSARPRRVKGVPEVRASGQGGLLDVMVPRDFATSRRIWLSYSHPGGNGASTGLGVGRLSADGAAIEGFARVHSGPPSSRGQHFGSRVVEARDGSVFLTTGDRGQGPLAQDPSRPEGKVLRFDADGRARTAPAFAGQAVVPGLWSLGHRNIQGAALDGQGRLWTVEHGARGGDEINQPQAGRNYGWPVITYGVNYNGAPIGEGTARAGMEQPAHYWDPSIAPSGLVIHSGRGIPAWRGHFLTGSLNSDHIARLDPANGWRETRLAGRETARVRDVREAPDGSLWFLSVGRGTLWRLAAT